MARDHKEGVLTHKGLAINVNVGKKTLVYPQELLVEIAHEYPG